MKTQRVLLVLGFSALAFVVVKQSMDIWYLTDALNRTIDYLQQQQYDEKFMTIVEENGLGDLDEPQ